jgi:hydroxymethylpyrimidine pyrophosphatase-like HAD family hydrolase
VHANSHIEFLREALEVEQSFAHRPGARVPNADRDDVARATSATRRAMARFDQRYLARKLLGDISGDADGPLCAIDVDGVLETAARGYSSSSPIGVLSLGALIRHGYRPVLATGRSLDEVRDRCVAYRLQGGVAEYGAVVYDHLHDRVIDLLTDEQRQRLDELRSALSGIGGVQIDAGYRRTIRASFQDGSAASRRIPTRLAEEVLRERGLAGDIRVVPGYVQSDFITAGVDKATGLRVLLRALGERADGERPLALAVGDTELDVPMLQLARTAIAPANADSKIRDAGIEVAAGDCQRGLARAVGRLLGHYPGGCQVCSPPPLDRESALLFTVLSAQGGGRWGRLHHVGRLAAQLMVNHQG